MSSDTTRARTVRRLGWLLGDGRWRVRTVDPEMNETTVDLGAPSRLLVQLERAENQLLGIQAKVEAILARAANRRRWGMTVDEVLADIKHELFEVHVIATGKDVKR